MEYQIIHSRRRKKSTTIKINPGGEVVIMVPARLSKRKIAKIIDGRKDWIEKQLEKLESQPQPVRKNFVDGEGFPFFGETYPLRIEKWDNTHLQLELQRRQLCSCGACPASEGGDPWVAATRESVKTQVISKFAASIPKNFSGGRRKEKLRGLFTQWYINHGTPEITAIASKYTKTLGLQFNRVKLKRVRSTWGSCSAKNNLNFNWKIVLAPLPIIHYLVIHEICHLRHRNHRPAYWKLVRNLDPNYKEHQTWLKENWWRLSI